MVYVRTVPTTLLPDDPRWIGCWWLGYLLVAVGILLTSVPLWFFPSSMTGHRRQRRLSTAENDVTAHESGRKTIVGSIWTEITGLIIITSIYSLYSVHSSVGLRQRPVRGLEARSRAKSNKATEFITNYK